MVEINGEKIIPATGVGMLTIKRYIGWPTRIRTDVSCVGLRNFWLSTTGMRTVEMGL